MTAPLLALAFNVLFDDVVFYELILGIGAVVGYGFATVFGIPAYLLYFRTLEPITKLPFVWFTLVCLLGYCAGFVGIMVGQSGLGALFSPTFVGYGLIFFVSASISVTAFYLIAFQNFGGRQNTEEKTPVR
jgi:tetrahydromethanopterin S-methyltransferase subunit E